MDHRVRSPLRLLAPIALIATTLVFFLVLVGSLGDDERDSAGTDAAAQRSDASGERGGGERSRSESYEVESGDTLDAISAETGVSVERILELNPDLDPQSLLAGQELKLRE